MPRNPDSAPATTQIPGFTRPVLAAVWAAFWLLMIAVSVLDYRRSGRTEVWQPVLWEVSSALTATALLLLQLRLVRPDDRWLSRPLGWFARYFVWLPAFWVAFVAINFSIRHAVYAALGRSYRHEPWPDVFLYEGVKLTVFYGLAALIVFGLGSFRAWVRERERLAAIEASLREARLAQLTQQIQPHFLFNALNLVSSVMHSDVARADSLLVRLGDLLRASLDRSSVTTVSFAVELELLHAYIDIMRERYADRVRVDVSIEPAALACRIPPMTLQPLVENVFKHTVEREPRLTMVAVAAVRAGDELHVSVRDDRGELSSGWRDGVGLGNVRRRFEAIYGGRARLIIAQTGAAGVCVELALPCAP